MSATTEKPAPAIKSKKSHAVVPVYSTNRGLSLSPSRVTNAIAALDGGDYYEAALLFDEMEERDSHLAAVMQTRAAGVLSLEMTITPGGDDGKAKKIAETVSDIFWAIPGVYRALGGILKTGLGYGSCLAEIYWDVKDGRVVVSRLEPKEPRWMRFDDLSSSFERLTDFPRWATKADPRGIELNRQRFLFFAPEADRKHPCRAGIYRGLIWLWLFCNFSIKDWLTFNEIYGTPLRVGKYTANASDDDREELQKAVAALGADGAATIPESTVIEFVQLASRGKPVYQEALEFFNAEKSKRVLGQTLTTEQGQRGARSLGEVHNDVRDDIKTADARMLEEVINRDVIKPLVDFNFGPQAAYPYLVIQTDDSPDVAAIIANAAAMKTLGFSVSEEWVREQTGIPAAENKTGKGTSKTDDEETPAENELALNALQVERANDVGDAIYGAAMDKYFETAYSDFVNSVAEAMGSVNKQPDVDKLAAAMTAVMITAGLAGYAAVLAEAREAQPENAGATNSLLLNGPGGGLVIEDAPDEILTPEAAARWWSQKLSLKASDYAELEAREKAAAFAVAKLENSRITERLKNLFGQALAEDESGLLTFRSWYKAALAEARAEGRKTPPFINKAHAETVFRNNIQTAFNAARYDAFTGEYVAEVFPHLRLSIIKDDATSEICSALAAANVTLPRDHAYWKSHWPPFHHNCRTTVVGVSKFSKVPVSKSAPAGIEYDPGFQGNPALARPISDPGKNF